MHHMDGRASISKTRSRALSCYCKTAVAATTTTTTTTIAAAVTSVTSSAASAMADPRAAAAQRANSSALCALRDFRRAADALHRKRMLARRAYCMYGCNQ